MKARRGGKSRQSRQLHRLGNQIRQHLAHVLQTKVRDPRLDGIVLSSVEVSADLGVARVHYLPAANAEPTAELDDTLGEALEKAAGFLRSSLASELEIRRIPQLIFVRDQGLADIQEIDRLLKEGKSPL